MSKETIKVNAVDGTTRNAEVSRFRGFPLRGRCGFRDEWLPGILHVVNIHDMIPHQHGDFEEIFLVLEGSGTIYLGGTPIKVGKWDTVRVPLGVTHQGVPDEGKNLVTAVFLKKPDKH